MSPGSGVADVADLRTACDDVDYPFWSRLNGFVRSIVAISKGILPLICKEVLEITFLKELGYL